jgi:hypothetical protein
MTIFWLVVAAALLVASRTVPLRIKSTGFGEAVSGLCSVAMLACLGLAFFALFDTPSRPTYGYAGPMDFTIPKVLIGFLGVGVAVWTFMAMMSRASRSKAAAGDDFRSPLVSLTVDRVAGVVRLTRRDSVIASSIPIGRMVIDVIDVGDGPADLAKVTVSRRHPPFLGEIRLSPESMVREGSVVFDDFISPSFARPLVKWRDAHPDLAPPASEDIEWREATDGLLRYVRQQRKAAKDPALEFWTIGNGPWLNYLVVEEDGSVLVASGEHPPLVIHAAHLRADLTTIDTEVNNKWWTFPLDARKVSVLQRLQSRGVLTLERRPPGS